MHASAPSRTRIIFFRLGRFSHTNESVVSWLQEQFPRSELIQIDILQEVIKPSLLTVLRGCAEVFLNYLPRIQAGDRDYRAMFYRTPYIFKTIRRLVRKKYAHLARECLFSVQTQSLWDARIPGLPHFIYTDHTHLANLSYPRAHRSQLYSRKWIELEKSLYLEATKNLVMSEFVRNSLINDYQVPPDQIAVVGAAPNVPPPNRPPNNAGYSNKTAVYVGIDWERKGGPILLEAFKKLLTRMPDARLLIAGAAPKIDLPNVTVIGRVPLAEISNLLLDASLLALPSWREPQGMICIEALMLGIPIVATPVGALPDVVKDRQHGRIVPPGDSNALADAMFELLSNPDLCRQYGNAGREHARLHYSHEAASRNFGDAIRSSLHPLPAGV